MQKELGIIDNHYFDFEMVRRTRFTLTSHAMRYLAAINQLMGSFIIPLGDQPPRNVCENSCNQSWLIHLVLYNYKLSLYHNAKL